MHAVAGGAPPAPRSSGERSQVDVPYPFEMGWTGIMQCLRCGRDRLSLELRSNAELSSRFGFAVCTHCERELLVVPPPTDEDLPPLGDGRCLSCLSEAGTRLFCPACLQAVRDGTHLRFPTARIHDLMATTAMAAINMRRDRTMRRGFDAMNDAIAALDAAGPDFDAGLYARAARLVLEYAYSDLVGGDLLFGLARRHKLTQIPPLPLSVDEIAGGLDGVVHSTSELEARVEVFSLVLSDLESMEPDWSAVDAAEGQSLSRILEQLLQLGLALNESPRWPDTQHRLGQLLLRWLPASPDHQGDDSSIAVARALCATPPGDK